MSSRSRAFLIGFIAGSLSVAVTAVVTTLGALVGVPLLVIGIFVPPRLYGAAGTLMGFGLAQLVLFGRTAITCQPPDCSGPSVEPLIVAGAISFAAGIGLLGIAYVRRPR
jgi:hypothetical protein